MNEVKKTKKIVFFSFNSLLVLVQVRESKKDTKKAFFPFNSQPVPVLYERVKKTEKSSFLIFSYRYRYNTSVQKRQRKGIFSLNSLSEPVRVQKDCVKNTEKAFLSFNFLSVPVQFECVKKTKKRCFFF
jgi:hypothetical protein